MHVALLLYLWTLLYPSIAWSIKAINIDIKLNRFRGENPEHNIKSYLLTPNLRCWKIKGKKKTTSLVYQLLFSLHKPFTFLLYIELMIIMIKHALLSQPQYILLYNLSYISLSHYIWNPQSYTLWYCYFIREVLIQPTEEICVIRKVGIGFIIDPIND